MLSASCHCGAVRMEIHELPETITECNCSICHRYGARWAYYTPQQVNIICKPDAFSTYIWGDKFIAFCHCNTCGCVTHYESLDQEKHPRIAVNTRSMPQDATASIPVRKFDGASMQLST